MESLKNKKLIFNVALCSFGMSGRVFHAPFIEAHKGFKLYAVLERTKTLAVEKYSNIITYKKLNNLCLDANIDIVIINTPSITHYDFAKQALLANKHVIVEKPFTATVSEANELIKIAKNKNLFLSVFQNRRWDSDFKTVKKIIESKILGDIKEVEIHYDRFTPTLSPKLHKEIPTAPVGILYDLGSHLIDQALDLFGMPQAIFADIMQMRPSTLVDDYFEILLYYSNFRVRLKASFFAKQPQGYIVHGSKGSFVKSRADVQETSLQLGLKPNIKNWGKEKISEKGILCYEENEMTIKKRIKSEVGNYMQYYNQVYDYLSNKNTPIFSPHDGKNIIYIIECALKSNKEKRLIVI